jgi:predicted transcriptional regulator
MTLKTVTLQLPENLYLRLQQTAQATKQSFDTILLRALQIGSRAPRLNFKPI